MKQKFVFIDVMKVIAIVLITNSHFKPIYEGSLSQFAFGGALGCSMFFFCSGYTSMLSKQRPFFNYIFHKIIRIYPTVWLLLLITGHGFSIDVYILLQHFWFLQALLIFYFIFWFIKKYLNRQWVLVLLIMTCLLISIISYYNYPHPEWMIDHPREHMVTFPYYFSIMLLGAILSKNSLIPQSIVIKTNTLRVLLVSGCIAITYGFKYLHQHGWLSNDSQQSFPFLLLLSCFVVFEALFYMQHTYKFMTIIATLTLEIYVVQIDCIHFCSKYSFPLRLMLVVSMIIATAWLLQLVRNFLVKLVEKLIKKYSHINCE